MVAAGVTINLTATMKNGDFDLFGLKYFLIISMVVNPSSAFTAKCPSPSQWNIRANSQCPITDGYMCLFDENENYYREICRRRTYFDPAGYKFVITGNPDRRECDSARYQPFKFSTNGMSVCIFEKTYCSEEGQIIFNNGSTNTDRTCRCDYTRDYDFVIKPKHGCFCVPSIEDCSCYQKPCQQGLVLSPDYQCINLTSWNSQFTCDLILPYKPKDTNHPSNDNNLDGGKAAPERNVRFIFSIVIGVTLIVTLIIVHILLFCLPKIESFKAKKTVLRENIELRSILAGKVIPQNIKDLQQHAKKQWRERFSHFVETGASEAIIKRIEEEQCLIISGPFGCGKSTLAFHIALKLEETLEYSLMIISNPDDLLKYASEDKKQLFLIDDVFGKYSVSEYDMVWWERQGDSIQHLLTRNKNLRLLMTSRLHIYRSVNLEKLNIKFFHLNLTSEKLALTYEVRQNIGRCYLGDDVIYNLGAQVISLYSFFPALCANFYDYKAENDIQYFALPLEYIKTEIENIRKSQDLFYLALSVLIVCDNSVENECLNQNNHKYDEMLKFLSKELGYGKKTPKQLLLLRLIALTGSYVSKKESSFECLNVNLFNVLAFCIGPSVMQSILRYGTMSFIIERMQPETSSGHYPKLTIIIPKSSLETYFERVLVDIKSGSYDIFIGNQHNLLAEYREPFITYMKKNLKKGVLKKGIDATTVLHVVSAEGYEEYVDFFLGIDKNMVNQQDIYGQTALHKACMKGHINISKLLLDNGSKINIHDNDSKTALDVACDSGLRDTCMVEFLLSRKAKICPKATDSRTALHVACDNDKFEVAELLLKYKANVNKQDYYGYTCLHLACKNGHVDIVELLIKHKPKLNFCDDKGRTALFFAVYRNDIGVVESLLKSNANPNIGTEQGRVPLYCASEQGSLEIAKVLLTYKAFVDSEDAQGWTPLYVACRNGHFEVAKLLLLHKANPNRRNEFRYTPILIACETNHIEIVKLLLDNKADVNCKNQTQMTPLHVACFINNKDIVSLLIKNGALIDERDKHFQTALFLACLKGYHSVAAELLRHGASMSKANQNGQTPLHIACEKVHEETVKILLNAGANVNESDTDGMTPLHMACEGEREEIIKLLISAGADVTKHNKDGKAPLDIARKREKKEIVSLLLKANNVVNKGEKDYMPSLYKACTEGNENFVRVFLNSVANVNECDKDGVTPLHMACQNGREQIVAMLINAGVDVNKGDKNGITPLQMACKVENKAIVKVLLNSVANVNEGDTDGTTPLHVACTSGNKDIITLLFNAGANVSKADKNGIKPFYFSYNDESEETLNGVPHVNPKGDADGIILLNNTFKDGREEIDMVLLDADANVIKDDKDCMTSMKIACTEGNKSI